MQLSLALCCLLVAARYTSAVEINSEFITNLSNDAKDMLESAKPFLQDAAQRGYAFAGNAFGTVASFFKTDTGVYPLEGTDINLQYTANRCEVHFSWRSGIERTCEATVLEPVSTLEASCTRSNRPEALRCAAQEVLALMGRAADRLDQ